MGTVTGTIYKGGIPWPNVEVYFDIVKVFSDGEFSYPAFKIPTTTDDDGVITPVVLPTPDNGSIQVRLILPSKEKILFWHSTADGDITVEEIILGAGTEQQIDTLATLLTQYLKLTGGTMTGPLLLDADPVEDLEAVTKQYVDAGGAAAGVTSWFGLDGVINLSDVPSGGFDAADDYLLFYDAATGTIHIVTGTSFQLSSGKLDTIITATWAADRLLYLTGTSSVGVTAFTAFMRTLLDDADQATALTTLGAAAATDLATHADLTVTAHGGVLPTAADPVTVASSRDIASTDGGKLLAVTATANLNCPDGIAANLQCAIASHGGVTTITADTTLQYLDGGLQTAGSGLTVNTQCTLVHYGSNVWVAYGDVTPI